MRRVQDLEGYDEVVEHFVRTIPAAKRLAGLTLEQRLQGLTPEQRILCLPDDILRLMPDDYRRTLPAEVQDALNKRIGPLPE